MQHFYLKRKKTWNEFTPEQKVIALIINYPEALVAYQIIMIDFGHIFPCSQVTSLMDKVRRILVHVCKDGGVPQPAHFLQVRSFCL